MGQGGQELGLTFGSNNPIAREIQEVSPKKRWEVKLAPCPFTSTSTHTGKGAGSQGDRVVSRGRGQGLFLVCSHKSFSFQTEYRLICVPALKGGIGWQHGGGR